MTGTEPSTFHLHVEGKVTVSQAFSAFIIPVGVQIGERMVEFRPDRTGKATNGMDSFRIKNVSQYGVVYGGSLEFETNLRNAAWLGEVRKFGNGPAALSVPITMRIGKAEHKATAEVTFALP